MNETLKNPRRILMTADTVGGIWTYVIELARALETHDIEIALATMGRWPSPTQRAEARSIRTLELFESGFKLEWMENPWADVAEAGEWLLGLEAELTPDVVHLNGYTHGALGFRAPTLVVGHACVLSWWQAVHRTEAPYEWQRYGDAVAAGLQAADLVVAPSQAMLHSLETHYGKMRNTAVIHHGRLLPGAKANGRQNFILSAGRIWDKAKNIWVLADLAPRLPWPIFIAGEGNGRTPATGNVRHLGWLTPEELATYFRSAAIYALPAYYEPFGLSALEAGLGGCALVLGNIPSLREIWGDAAVFVAPDSQDELLAALRELIRHPDLLWAMGERARVAAGRFTPEAMGARYLEAYRCLLKSPRNKEAEALTA